MGETDYRIRILLSNDVDSRAEDELSNMKDKQWEAQG
jgi:hypothetical protein